MFQYHCLNPIAQKGLDIFDDNYKKADTLDDCAGSSCKKCQDA